MLHLQGVEPSVFRVITGRLSEALEGQLLDKTYSVHRFPRQIHHLVKHLGCYQAGSQVDDTLLAAVLRPSMALKEDRGVSS